MSLLELAPLVHLREEFRQSMRRLLQDLGRELQVDYAPFTARFHLPVGLFELLHHALNLEAYSNWKVVGWIEGLNDLVYFLDVLRQWQDERDRREFTAQLFGECQETFFEHGYLDDLFPSGRPRAAGLERRLTELCDRLARELTQEALFLDPIIAIKWCRQHRMTSCSMEGSLADDFERAEPSGTVFIGSSGAYCVPPRAIRQALARRQGRVTFQIEPDGINVKMGKTVLPLWSGWGREGAWQWPIHEPLVAAHTAHGPVTVGPTLVYGRDRQPTRLIATEQRMVDRIARAWATVQEAWPEGHALLALLTSRLVPLRAKGVVSFSYRHRPGLSFINCFERDNLDLIDDLIHENSHHHLNLLLRKHVMYHGDHHQQIFYSPWRRSLRPIRGILHATFTFTMGAMLFERLSSWASGRGGAARWKKAGLTARDLDRARFRCLEEVESVRYSLQDLHYADHHLGWLTGSGRRLVGQLAEAIDRVERNAGRFKNDVLRSSFGPALRRHIRELHQARMTYGPVRLGKV